MTYVWRGLALPQLAVGLPVSLPVSVAARGSLDEGDVVIVGAGGSGQDPQEVTVVAEVLQQTGHPPEDTRTETHWLAAEPVRLCRPHWFLRWVVWYQYLGSLVPRINSWNKSL